LLKLEVVYFVWAYKWLYILLHSNNHRIVVLIDYKVTRGIVYHSTLNTIFIDRVNWRFINTLVYLSAYLLEVYYIFDRFNYMPDVLLYLRTIGDNVVWKSTVEPTLDILWDEDLEIEVRGVFFIFSEIYIDDIFR